jgi:TetR/AcrR family transcriptional regulator, regulator of cefoperazone and chloramphenicol sensitivity
MSNEDVRTRLLLAAGPVFAGKGYRVATVREICRSANVNVASINYYFGDKETLYVETVKCARQHRAGQHPMPDWPPDTPAETRLRDFITTMVRRIVAVEASNWHVRLMLREVVEPTGICREMVEEYIDPLFGTLVGILGELLPATTPPHVLRQTAFSVVGQCLYYRVADEVIGLLVDPLERREHYQPDQLAAHIADMTLAALGAGPTLHDKFAVSQVAERY